MIKIQNPKPVALSKERTFQRFGHLILEFDIFLYFEACNLGFSNSLQRIFQ